MKAVKKKELKYIGKWSNGWRFQVKRIVFFVPIWLMAWSCLGFCKYILGYEIESE